MNNFQKGLFDKIQKNANIKPEDVFKVADSVKNADFTDEKTVRRLVRQLSKIANKPVSKEKENKIVESIVKNKMPADMQSLNELFKK
ncbi:stage VI sporulation protein F [Virgibacillus halodenitrificans]|uniref:Stage VI sporulation protein F n=1 Tax=Virgibacillus halodenitrificans TaxID=1482 RepID=A0AAC9J243_VIRHA|nr:stage VI sporulation protein F [Virgibacillus halodenitrificans]APC48425.1 stage VI sporulation protein F [Virgibacillus halodenitrificans]MBD1222621.1 stage VI sporulation protein F [Virgibacillus halodenitrificans]MCJ0930996.1 stage VI sporulation protein F [Virgibacillus halodenitrificans]MEC2160383.1 stage VI sporulation protein F [Virgibacillus halodenitrificans]MYL47507.1 stage VI sporulation protein F [Virgibacillus halodenitrificans]